MIKKSSIDKSENSLNYFILIFYNTIEIIANNVEN